MFKPAPVDQSQLADALKPFGQSHMLPVGAYLDEEVLAWEKKHIFSGWVALGRAEELSRPRQMKAYPLGPSSVLVARGDDGVVRGFQNACRHRGHELLSCDAGAEARAIVCPYHAWSYRLDGSLIGAPGHKDAEHFDPADYPLFNVEVVEWHGWLFANGGTDKPFADHVEGLDEVVANYDGVDLVTAETHEYDVDANWKVIVENYQECYHCPSIHPELCKVSPPDSGDNLDPRGDWMGGDMDLRDFAATMSLDGHSDGTVMEHLNETQQHTVMYLALMPNMLLSLHPDYVMTHLLTPIAPGKTRIRCSWAFPRKVVEEEGFDPSYAVDFWDITNRQDWTACESVQRGMQTPTYVPGPLAPAEDGVYDFVTYVARAYAGESDD